MNFDCIDDWHLLIGLISNDQGIKPCKISHLHETKIIYELNLEI